MDFEESATLVYGENFPDAVVENKSIDDFVDGKLGKNLTRAEQDALEAAGDVDLLVGGPPCQGHSDLNNHTRRDDPKNAYYARMARAAEVLEPSTIVIENVPTVRHDVGKAVDVTTEHLRKLGYKVDSKTIGLHALGVAQKRKRHVLLATKLAELDPTKILDELAGRSVAGAPDLKWAIGDLADLKDPVGYDVPPRASDANLKRMKYMLRYKQWDLPNSRRPVCHQDDHSYKSMYGRLRWDSPAQTITSGFGSIGQGRYMHPSLARALTPHEAARIQGFPDYFDFAAVAKRADLATMIGNAVPPALMREIGGHVVGALLARIEPNEEVTPPSAMPYEDEQVASGPEEFTLAPAV